MKIVAEIGGSHGNNFDHAKRLIEVAAQCGAWGVKFQTLTPETIAADVMVDFGPWQGMMYRDLYQRTMLPWDWHAPLFDYARSLGLVPFSTPFSEAAVDFLETLDCPMYKIASSEITHLDLIYRAAETGKPLIISTGAATMNEIDDAVMTAVGADLTLLVCVASYPAAPEDYPMALLETLRANYDCRVGVSDHTKSTLLPTVAAAAGACMLERHLSLTQHLPDDCFASWPREFSAAVAAVRRVESMFKPKPQRADAPSRGYRRSLWVTKPIAVGEAFTRDNVAVLRPYHESGFKPEDMLGLTSGKKRASRALEPNTPLTPFDVE